MNILKKGIYKKIDDLFIMESMDGLQSLTAIQEKFDKMDSDTF